MVRWLSAGLVIAALALGPVAVAQFTPTQGTPGSGLVIGGSKRVPPKYLMPDDATTSLHWSAADWNGATLRPKIGSVMVTHGTVPTGAGLSTYVRSVGPFSDSNYLTSASNNDEGDTTGGLLMAYAFIADACPSVLASDGVNATSGWYVQGQSFRQQPSNNGAAANACLVGAMNLYCMWRNGTTLNFSLNGGIVVSTASGTVTQDTGNPLYIGRYGGATGFSSNVRMLEMEIRKGGTYTSADCASIYSAVQGLFGQTRAVFLGDSLVYGYNGTTQVATPMPAGVAALGGSLMFTSNGGVSGYTTSQILDAWTNTYRNRGFTNIFIEGGANDIGSGTVGSGAAAFANLKTIADQARSDGLHITWSTVTPSSLRTGQAITEQNTLNADIRAEAAANGDQIEDSAVDLADPNNANALNPSYDCGDHLHMSQTGYTAWAHLVVGKIR